MVRSLSALLLASTAIVPMQALAQSLPSGGTVAAGSAEIGAASGGGLNIRQNSDAAIINWQSFNVERGNRVDIAQPSATATLLNRVTGGTTTTIAGQINANGRVFIVNPNGILITPTGSVKAAGFVGSTLDIADDAFMAGRYDFSGDGGIVVNGGRIEIARGGYAALLGGKVNNSGLILAPMGKVAIGAGSRATLDFSGDGFLKVAIGPDQSAQLDMSGRIAADGGSVILSAAQARAAARSTVNLTGVIEARGVESRGGNVTLTGGDIALSGATIDVSGASGGGTVKIGGDRQGIGSIAHAETLRVDAATTIRADATSAGTGGDIVLWSDKATSFAGTISARGASAKGGEAEVSSKGQLGYSGTADLTGSSFGTLLLDPYNLTISNAASSGMAGFAASGDDSVLNASALTTALATANVIVQTGSTGSQAGNITVSAPLSWTSSATLTLNAANNIALNSAITAQAGGLTLASGGTITQSGAIAIGRFYQTGGSFRTVAALLPSFEAGSFGVDGGSFVRALGGDGTSATPWLLTDVYGLQGMTSLRSAHFALANDIDASGTVNWNGGAGFRPIGGTSGSFGNSAFTGSLDGRSHAISGLRINQPSYVQGGLFTSLNGATVRNLRIVSESITMASLTNPPQVGGLAATMRDTIVDNVHVDTTIDASAFFAIGGGIAARVTGNSRISNVSVSGFISPSANAGGIVGELVDTSTISGAYVTAQVGGFYAAGIADTIGGAASISDVWVSGFVAGVRKAAIARVNDGIIANTVFWDADTAGTATGVTTNSGTNGSASLTTAQARTQAAYAGFDFTNTWFQAGDMRPILRSEAAAAGTDGYISVSTLNQLQLMSANLSANYRLANDIDATSTNGAVASRIWGSGGFVPIGLGSAFSGNLDGANHAISNLTINRPTTDFVGLVSQLRSTPAVSIRDVRLVNAAVTGKDATGALVGSARWDLTNVWASGTVSGGARVGGIAGEVLGGTLSNLHFDGAVQGSSEVVGGVIGNLTANASNLSATGSVAGTTAIGGISGRLVNNVTLSTSFSTASVTASGFTAGGAVGRVAGGTLTNVWASGAVTAPSNAGGLVGSQDAGTTVSNSYWDMTSTGQTLAVAEAFGTRTLVTGLTTAQARNAASYANFANFSTTWYQGGDMRPILRGEALAASGGTVGVFNARQLQLVNANVAGNYTLLANIDLSATNRSAASAGVWGANGWTPLGSLDNRFTGTLNGANRLVSNLKVANADYAGLFGFSDTNASIRDFTVSGTVSGATAGGLIGDHGGANSLISGVTVNVAVTGSIFAGGLAGRHSAAITRSSASGAVTGNGASAVGGLIGELNTGELSYSFATGAVTSNYNGGIGPTTGGLIGLANGRVGAIHDVYATGSVTVTAPGSALGAATGGLIGENIGSITNAYSTGQVTDTASTYVGGSMGRNVGTVSGIFWNTQTSGRATGIGYTQGSANGVATGLTTAQMTDLASYATTYAGFDFNSVWVPPNQSGQGGSATAHYPELYALANAVVVGASSRAYGDDNTAFVATYSGLQSHDYLKSAGTLTTAATATSGAGTYATTLTAPTVASLSGRSYRTLLLPSTTTLTVTPRAITIAANVQTNVYGNALGTLTYSVLGRGLANGDTLSGALATSAVQGSNVGTYAITQGTLGASADYAVTYSGANLSITARPITITADARSRIYGNANPTLTYTVGGSGLYASDTLSGALTTTATQASNIGSYAITQGTLAATGNYSVTYVGANLSVTTRPITVTADALSRIYGNANPALTYTVGGSGLYGSDTLSGALATTATQGSNVGSYAITRGTLGASTNYAVTYTGANLSITARPITVTADALSRIYGNANPALTYTVGGSGLYGSDTLSGALATTAVQGSNVGSYAITQGTLAASANYAVTYAGANLTVTARPVTVAANTQSRVYGNANPTLTYTVGGSGLYGSDTLSGALTTTATQGSNIGSYAITQGTLGATGNYAVTYTGANLSVTARPITVTADALSRIYGDANPTLTYTVGGSGLYGSDTLSGALATSATQGSNVGSYAITRGTLGATGNYAVTYTGANLSVTARPITVTADALSRIYGNANPALTYTVGGSGLYGSDTLSGALTTTATQASNIGSYAITQGTLGASTNYAVTYVGANLSVTARPITVTADALSRIYGNANPALTYTVGGSGLYGSDTLSGALATTAVQGSNVGSYAITQGTLAASANYAVTYAGANLAITARPVTVAANTQSRVYGNANPTLTYTVGGSGLYGSDTLSGALATSATQGSNIGSYAITQGTLGATGNYAVTYTGANLSVTARPITVTADALSRIYGNANPALTYTIGGSGLYGSDTLSGALATTATQSSNVGSYAITQGTLGTSGNYAVTYTGANLSVTARPITVTADALSRIYGNANPTLTYTVGGSGLYGSDTLSGALTTSAAQGSNVGSYAIAQGTLGASTNYAVTYAGANLTVTARPITVTADALSRIYGNANPALTYTVGGSGLYGSDTLSGALATTATQGSNVGSYAITQGTLGATGNYAVTYTSSNLSVTARPITVTADALSRIYGNANPALTYTVGGSGLYGSDTLSGALTTSAAQGSNVGSYAITQGTLGTSGNYAVTYTGANLSVTARPITVTADALSRIYGNANPALTYTVGGSGLYGSDTLSGALTTSAAQGSNVGSYAITQGTLGTSGNYAVTYTGANLSVTARPITVTADALSRIYGNANPALTYTVGGSGLYGSDTLSGALATTAMQGSNVGSYAIAQGTLGTTGNYAVTYTGANLSVTARPITVTADALSRIYGNANPALTYTVGGSGLYGSDTLSGALTTSAAQGSNVGSYAITLGTLGTSGNYAVTYTGANLSVTARPITVTADALSRIYGNANPALTYTVGGSGLYGSDTLSGALATTAVQSSNIGSYAITQGTLGATGNYAVTYTGANLSVTARPITVTADALSRIYGNANPALTYTVGGSGLYGSDTLSGALATTATQGSNVGGYAITQGTLGTSGNYAVTYTGANLAVTARPITVAADALSRIYGDANPALTYSVGGSGLYGSDTLSGALATTATQGSNVGSYAITQGTLGTSGNYAVTYTGANLAVTARPITVTADALSRIYGDANPALTYTVGGSGLYGSDTLSGALTTSAAQGSNVGSYAITQGTLGTSGNYAVTYTGANLSVTARPITVTADALSRIYGNANPAFTYTVGGSGLYGSDSLSGALATTATQGSNIGSYAITQGTLGATGNYAVTYTGANLSITARPITVTADALSRIYGNVNPALTYTVGGSGLYGSDTLSGALATTATQGSNIGSYAITQGTLGATANYAVTYTGANLSVTARPITVTADALSRIYGNANPALTYTVGGDGLYGSDTLSGALTTTATQGSNVGSYAITQGTLGATGNYAVTYTGANLSVTARPISVAADDLSRPAGQTNPPLTYSVSGLVNGDVLTGGLATSATADSLAGAYAITQGNLAATPNYQLQFAPATLTVTENRQLSFAIAFSASGVLRDAVVERWRQTRALLYTLRGDGSSGTFSSAPICFSQAGCEVSRP